MAQSDEERMLLMFLIVGHFVTSIPTKIIETGDGRLLCTKNCVDVRDKLLR